jgi:23S rRNA pseudouridine1911/1915/1917 synthase
MSGEITPERLDHCLVRLGLASSRRHARELIADGRVRVNGRRFPKGASVTANDHVELTESLPPPEILPNPTVEIPVLYEDAAIIVVDKPGLMPCHPLRAGERDTVMNAVVARYPETAFDAGKPLEGGLVHRLDNATSGALMIARNPAALKALRLALRTGRVSREYHALVAGDLPRPIEILAPIAHHPKNSRKMIAVPGIDTHSGARPAITAILPFIRQGAFTMVKALPQSGRRHQIRVHLASIGHPLVGDGLYGGPTTLAALAPGRFWLHLARLELDTPTGGRVRLRVPQPPDLLAAMRALGF